MDFLILRPLNRCLNGYHIFGGRGLGWVGLGWVGLVWVGLGWVGLGWTVLTRKM